MRVWACVYVMTDLGWVGGGGGGGLLMMRTRCGLDADFHTHWRESEALACVCVCRCVHRTSIEYKSSVILHRANRIWQSADTVLAGVSSHFI